ncbi:MAG: hypothetical protein AB7I38_09710 [Dehalococcoidia bacterium]
MTKRGGRVFAAATAGALALVVMTVGAVVAAGGPAPANDMRTNASRLQLVNDSARGHNINATTESGEDLPCGSMGSTVWYQIYVPSGAGLEVNTYGSDYDTVLAVYKNPRSAPLVCNDDTNDPDYYDIPEFWYDSAVEVPGTPRTGQWYYIQVGGYQGDQGHIVLNYRLVH